MGAREEKKPAGKSGGQPAAGGALTPSERLLKLQEMVQGMIRKDTDKAAGVVSKWIRADKDG
jgi:hypothetical protein